MFDVFYFGPKPNLFEFERPASSLEEAGKLSRTGYYWYIYGGNDYAGFDFDYVPAPWQSHFTHVWGSQHHQDGNVYLTQDSNAAWHFQTSTHVHRLPVKEYWHIPKFVDTDSIDWRWCPNPLDPPYNYIFDNQWNSALHDITAVYKVPGATQNKHVSDFAVRVLPQIELWEVLDEIEDFDYSWRPNPVDPPYIYVFGNQWLTPEQRPALRYTVLGATEVKYMAEPKAKRQALPNKFITHYSVEFDYSWEPDPGSPPYNYVFGNQWYPGVVMPTVEYPMSGATETKFVDYPVATLTESTAGWDSLSEHRYEFDYSWVPDPGDPPMIYLFGNQHWPAEKMPTLRYCHRNITEDSPIKYMDEPRATLLENTTLWTVPEELNEKTIDYSWVPDPGEPPYIYHFGTDYQQSVGLTYTVPGATEIKFAGPIPARGYHKLSVMEVLPIFFIDKGNPTAQPRFEHLNDLYAVTKVRYANSMIDTIKRCATRARTNKFWVVSSENDYSGFDFRWHAQPWQSYMTHVFPSQHQKWSNTFLINKWEFERHTKWANSLEEFPNLNFVTDQMVRRVDSVCDMYYVDHSNPDSELQYSYLRGEHPDLIKTRAVNDYLDTFKRIVNSATTEYIWILNSVCDYTKFDFTWQPEPWQKEMIHVFPSNGNKRGDTFYIHVESFKKQMIDLDMLDWFNVINYCSDQKGNWFPIPTHYYDSDSLVDEIKNYEFNTPYVLFSNQKQVLSMRSACCLWSKKDRIVERMSRSGAISLVPREIKAHLKSQIYDYPYLDNEKTRVNDYYEGVNYPGCDIIYISNGEPDEEKWYEHLAYVSNGGAFDDIQWVRGVNGRTAAYQEAARRSRSPWFLAVFAKLETLGDFDWQWMPDYWQEPKHYIFNARNPVNDLEYGHQGVIAYNKRLVLANNTPGIDFTLTQPHESVPLLSGIAHFNQDAWMTWRTAFREVVKLKHFMATQPTLETDHRLNVWLTHAKGNYSNYCLDGARHAVEYYDEVGGDYAKLMLSFEWAWLRQRFDAKYQMRINEVITEALDKPYQLSWDDQFGPKEIHARAYDRQGRYIDINFVPVRDNVTDVEFSKMDNYKQTGQGDEFAVFSTVLEAFKRYLQGYQPKILVFSGKGETRSSLYQKLITKFAGKYGYKQFDPSKLSPSAQQQMGGTNVFILRKMIPVQEDAPITLSPDTSRAAAVAWIEKVYAQYPQTWQNNHVMPMGEEQFALFELVPSMSKRGAVEVKWFQAYPLRQGIGSRAMQQLQALAREDGIALTLFPWEHGQVSPAKLTKFYKGQGFKPAMKGSKSMAWEPPSE